MKTTRNLLLLATMMGYVLTSFAGERGPMSTTAIGHMSVTLLSPAALTDVQNLQFNDIDLHSAAGTVIENTNMASIKVVGNKSTYAVTISNQAMGYRQNDTNLSVDCFTSVTTTENSGTSNIYIGATMKVNDESAINTDHASSLDVTINYN